MCSRGLAALSKIRDIRQICLCFSSSADPHTNKYIDRILSTDTSISVVPRIYNYDSFRLPFSDFKSPLITLTASGILNGVQVTARGGMNWI